MKIIIEKSRITIGRIVAFLFLNWFIIDAIKSKDILYWTNIVILVILYLIGFLLIFEKRYEDEVPF